MNITTEHNFEVAVELSSPIPPAPGYVLVASVHAGRYHTQGFGARRYAGGEANEIARRYVAAGWDTATRPTATQYEVWARGQGVAGPFTPWLAQPSADSLRAWVQRCWKAGLNPRVYDPFLPAGYEERVGLDYFGNDVAQ